MDLGLTAAASPIARSPRVARPEQFGLDRQLGRHELPLPAVRPVADAELATTFLRAAEGWARWQEQRRWTGR